MLAGVEDWAKTDPAPAALLKLPQSIKFSAHHFSSVKPNEKCPPNQIAFWDEAPDPAVAAVVAVIPHHKVVALRHHTTQALIERGRNMPVVYISGESSLAQGIKAMKLSAQDFLVKPFTRESILKAVASGIEKDRIQMQRLIDQARFDEARSHLAPLERQVLELLVKGYSNLEIMNELEISLPTAKQYKSQLMRKLSVRSLSELIKLSAGLKHPS